MRAHSVMRVPLVSALVGIAITSWAEQLPLKIYTAADGLAHNSVHRIVSDSRGYLWYCTSEGLSRFDGYEFRSYGRRDGLPHRDVHDLIESRSGDFWIATGAGLCRLQPTAAGPVQFHVYRVAEDQRASYINTVLEDSYGQIWCGTDAGVFRLDRGGLQHVDLGMPNDAFAYRVVNALLEDPRGDIWIGAGSGLYRRRLSGGTERYTSANGLADNSVTSLLLDRQNRIWVGTDRGLCRLLVEPKPGQRVVERVFREADGLGSSYIRGLLQLRDGTLCAGTAHGLSVMHPGHEASFRTYAAFRGVSGMVVDGLAEDAEGNLWLGLDEGGAAKLTWHTFLTYAHSDGLRGEQTDSIFENRQGTLCVLTRGPSELFVNEFESGRFSAKKLNLPLETRLVNWGARSQSIAQDAEDHWWVGTGGGLLRLMDSPGGPEFRQWPARKVAIGPENLYGDAVFSVFEDAEGGLWVSTTGKRNGLARRDPRSRKLQHYSERDGLPPLGFGGVSLFAQDKKGEVWMGLFRFRHGEPGLVRFRGGRFQSVTCSGDTPGGGIRALHLDHRGRLWVGTTQGGVLRIDDPAADPPHCTNYTTSNGLSSDIVLSLTEDRHGRIYIGTGGGVDRLDAETGNVKRFTSADGLAAGEVHAAFCDHRGTLWFGTSAGVSRLDPDADHPRVHAPPVFITSLRVAGVKQPIAEVGATSLPGLRYGPNQDHIQFDFVGLDFAPGEKLRYQYKLEGADQEWSPPAEIRSVNYARLAPGSYSFRVRAVNSAGLVSTVPASISFTLLPPVWMRWWFRLALAASLAAIGYVIHRYRVTHLLELEQVRTRIATDLHDDIGSSLAQIAILSEVAGQRDSNGLEEASAPLADIAAISRELVDSMSDIVWAVDPEQDRLGDLVHRMRRFASDVFSSRAIRLQFSGPAVDTDLEMSANLRRQTFLIFKEALHNVLRHASATDVAVALGVSGGWLELEVQDNGRGFDATSAGPGHGLKSIQERAAGLGGKMEIAARPGAGTRVRLRIPLPQGPVSRWISRLPKQAGKLKPG